MTTLEARITALSTQLGHDYRHQEESIDALRRGMFIRPEDYGIGSSKTPSENYALFQTLLAELPTGTSSLLLLSDIYQINNRLIFPQEGSGGRNLSVFGKGNETGFFLYTLNGGVAWSEFTGDDATPGQSVGYVPPGGFMSNFSIVCPNITLTEYPFWIGKSANLSLDNVTVWGGETSGCYLSQCADPVIRQLYVNGQGRAAHTCLTVNHGTNGAEFYGLKTYNFGKRGILVGSDDSTGVAAVGTVGPGRNRFRANVDFATSTAECLIEIQSGLANEFIHCRLTGFAMKAERPLIKTSLPNETGTQKNTSFTGGVIRRDASTAEDPNSSYLIEQQAGSGDDVTFADVTIENFDTDALGKGSGAPELRDCRYLGVSENRPAGDTVVIRRTPVSGDVESELTSLSSSIESSQLNALSNDGSFIDLSSATYNERLINEMPFDVSEFSGLFLGYNGFDTSAMIEAGRKYSNDGAAGGLESQSNAVAQKFMAAMGLDITLTSTAEGRYIFPFAIAEGVTGPGTSGARNIDALAYRILNTSRVSKYKGASGRTTVSLWFESVGVDSYIVGSAESSRIQTYLDGVLLDNVSGDHSADVYILAADTVHHICVSMDSPAGTGSISDGLQLYSADSTTVRFACPAVVSGVTQIQPNAGVVNSLIRTQPDAITLNDSIATSVEDLRTETYNALANSLPNSGAFLDLSSNAQLSYNRNTATFDHSCLSDYFEDFNGSTISAPVEASRFYYDSSTMGGAELALDATAIAFAEAMGMDTTNNTPGSGRYLPSFGIAEFDIGSGTSSFLYALEYYRAISTGGLTRRIGTQGVVSCGMWMQPAVENCCIGTDGPVNYPIYIDGVKSDEVAVLLYADTVYHVAFSCNPSDMRAVSTTGVILGGKTGGKIRVGPMYAGPGFFQVLPWAGVKR